MPDNDRKRAEEKAKTLQLGSVCFCGTSTPDYICMAHQDIADALITFASEVRKEQKTIPSCAICGGVRVLIRGRFPRTPDREECPTCAVERLEQIQQIVSMEYGAANQNDEVQL